MERWKIYDLAVKCALWWISSKQYCLLAHEKGSNNTWPRDGPNALGHQVPSPWLRVGKVSAPRQSGDHAKTVIVDLPSKFTFLALHLPFVDRSASILSFILEEFVDIFQMSTLIRSIWIFLTISYIVVYWMNHFFIRTPLPCHFKNSSYELQNYIWLSAGMADWKFQLTSCQSGLVIVANSRWSCPDKPVITSLLLWFAPALISAKNWLDFQTTGFPFASRQSKSTNLISSWRIHWQWSSYC